MLQPVTMHTATAQNKQMHIAIDFTINSCAKFEFIKFTIQTLNAQLSQRFTDHQRVEFQLFYIENNMHLLENQ